MPHRHLAAEAHTAESRGVLEDTATMQCTMHDACACAGCGASGGGSDERATWRCACTAAQAREAVQNAVEQSVPCSNDAMHYAQALMHAGARIRCQQGPSRHTHVPQRQDAVGHSEGPHASRPQSMTSMRSSTVAAMRVHASTCEISLRWTVYRQFSSLLPYNNCCSNAPLN